MEKLNLSKRVEIEINGDPERVIRFNPEDVHLRARLFEFSRLAAQKEKEIQAKAAEIEALSGEDDNGIPNQAMPTVALMVEYADFFMTQIDDVFGDGTSKKVFADGFDFDSATIFLKYVLEKLGGTSEQKIEQRLSKKTNKKLME